jgi:hypothetical protein
VVAFKEVRTSRLANSSSLTSIKEDPRKFRLMREEHGGTLMRFLLTLAICVAGLSASASKTHAQNQARCDAYWVERNSILKTYRYCFRSPRATFHFGNSGCLYSGIEAVPLPTFERDRLTEIRAMEAGLRCPSRRAS